MNLDELLELPVVCDLETAGRALGLGRTKAYELARTNEFPVPVLRLGNRFKVPTSPLLQLLGVSPTTSPTEVDDAGSRGSASVRSFADGLHVDSSPSIHRAQLRRPDR